MQHRPLSIQDLLACGPLRRLGAAPACLDETDSTNRQLLARARDLPDGAVLTAEYQSAGRGRQGRSWVAPRGSSLLLSALLREAGDSARLAHMATVGCVAACEAVERSTTCRPMIRWPNDLVIAGRKLGGVLAESTPLPDPAGGRAVALGIGLNCLQQAGHFPGELATRATSLEIESPQPVDRAALAGRLVERLDDWLSRPAEWLTAALRTAWRERSADAGGRATLHQNGRRFDGTIVEVTAEGDLVLQLDEGGRRSFESATTTRAW